MGYGGGMIPSPERSDGGAVGADWTAPFRRRRHVDERGRSICGHAIYNSSRRFAPRAGPTRRLFGQHAV